MIIQKTNLSDAKLIELEPRGDERGFFSRTFCQEEFAQHGLETVFVQQNMSFSAHKGTLRGMHFQKGAHAEDKLIRCVRGAILDVIIDLRRESTTYMKWEGFELNEQNMHQLFVPKGFAHGFQTLTENVEVTYLVSQAYAPDAESGLRWNDPAFNIAWPLEPTEMSDKDQEWPNFSAA